MNRLKKFSLAYALQVFGVIILFGYPGCSSNIKEQKSETGKDITVKNHAALKAGTNKAPQVPAAIYSIQQPAGVKINFASYLDFSK